MRSLYTKKGIPVLFSSLFIFFAAAAAFTEKWLLASVPFFLLIFISGWQNRNLFFYLLLLSLPLSFEYQFSSSLGTDVPDEGLMLLVAFIFFACWIYSPELVGAKTLAHPLVILLMGWFCWMIICTIFSTHGEVSIKYLLAKSWYIGAFVLAPLMVFRSKQSILTAGAVLSISFLLVASIIMVRHYGAGFGFAGINEAVTPFFRNHVNYSAMLVCLIPVTCAFFFHAGKKNKPLLAAAILFLITALFFSYARGAWLALLMGALTYGLMKMRLLFHSYCLAIVIIIASIFWLKSNDRYLQYAHDYKTTIFQEDFGKHLVSTYQLKDMSTAERFYRWIAGVRMIKDNWLTGYGPNTFYEHYKGYAIPAYKTWVSDNPERSTVHNYFLLVGVEQGLPGLLFLLILVGAMFYYAQHLYSRAGDPFYKTISAVTGVMITMIIVVNFFSDLVETDKIGSLFFLCLSMLIVVDMETRKGSKFSPDIQRIP